MVILECGEAHVGVIGVELHRISTIGLFLDKGCGIEAISNVLCIVN